MHFQVFGILAALCGLLVEGFANEKNSTSAVPKLVAAVAANSIPRDYVKYDNSYYKFHKDSQTWADARRICESEGAYLTIVNSEDEAYYLIRLLRQYPPSVLSPSYYSLVDYFYIGFHDLFEEGDFVTVDGKSVSNSGYDTWIYGRPLINNNYYNCGTYYRKGALVDMPCTYKLAYICEISDPCN